MKGLLFNVDIVLNGVAFVGAALFLSALAKPARLAQSDGVELKGD